MKAMKCATDRAMAAVIVQSPEEVRLQKLRFSLLCSGNALILFALWEFIRMIVQIYYQITFGTAGELSLDVILVEVTAGIVDMILKLLVGLSARAEARGKHKGSAYIVIGIILAILTVLSAVLAIINVLSELSVLYESGGLIGMIVSLAVEITVLYAELSLVISAVKVRRLEKTARAACTEEGRAQ